MKVMKTKIRTIIGIVALGLIGFTNINATIDNKNEVRLNVVAEKEEILAIEPWMLENEIWVKPQIDTIVAEKALEIEAWMLDEKLWK